MKLTIIYWRDIPTQLSFGKGRKAKKRPLADRFMVAVDKAAMVSGAADDDSYLEEWRREDIDIGDEAPEDALERIAGELEDNIQQKHLHNWPKMAAAITKGHS